jgi:hypothetical protein
MQQDTAVMESLYKLWTVAFYISVCRELRCINGAYGGTESEREILC